MSFKLLTATFLFIGIAEIEATIYDPTQDHMYTYGATDPFGPPKWHSSTCFGSEQNPFLIKGGDASTAPQPKLNFINIDEKPKEIKVINNGFGVFFKFIYHELTAPGIYGATLHSDIYQFDSFSYHILSEHETIFYPPGFTTPAIEFQFMHFNRKFKSVEEARKEPGGLAVIAVRYSKFQGGTGTPFPIPLLSLIGSVYNPFTEVSLSGSNLFTYADVLGFKTMPEHFAVHGSLTTPPCYESVQWFIMKVQRAFDIQDLDRFRNIKLWDGSNLQFNRRPDQSSTSPIYAYN